MEREGEGGLVWLVAGTTVPLRNSRIACRNVRLFSENCRSVVSVSALGGGELPSSQRPDLSKQISSEKKEGERERGHRRYDIIIISIIVMKEEGMMGKEWRATCQE